MEKKKDTDTFRPELYLGFCDYSVVGCFPEPVEIFGSADKAFEEYKWIIVCKL